MIDVVTQNVATPNENRIEMKQEGAVGIDQWKDDPTRTRKLEELSEGYSGEDPNIWREKFEKLSMKYANLCSENETLIFKEKTWKQQCINFEDKSGPEYRRKMDQWMDQAFDWRQKCENYENMLEKSKQSARRWEKKFYEMAEREAKTSVEAEAARHEIRMCRRKYESFRRQMSENRKEIDSLREKLLKKQWESPNSSLRNREKIPGAAESIGIGSFTTSFDDSRSNRRSYDGGWKNIADLEKLNVRLTLKAAELEIQVREWRESSNKWKEICEGLRIEIVTIRNQASSWKEKTLAFSRRKADVAEEGDLQKLNVALKEAEKLSRRIEGLLKDKSELGIMISDKENEVRQLKVLVKSLRKKADRPWSGSYAKETKSNDNRDWREKAYGWKRKYNDLLRSLESNASSHSLDLDGEGGDVELKAKYDRLLRNYKRREAKILELQSKIKSNSQGSMPNTFGKSQQEQDSDAKSLGYFGKRYCSERQLKSRRPTVRKSNSHRSLDPIN